MFKSLYRGNIHKLQQQLLSLPITITPILSHQTHSFSTNTNDALNLTQASPQQTTNNEEGPSFGSIKLTDTLTNTKYPSKVGIVSHPSCLFHEISDHPESPERLKAILDCLNNPEITDPEDDFSSNLTFIDNPTQITRSRITIAHSQSHVDEILDKAEEAQEHGRIIEIDPDTFISPHSAQSIMYAPACVSYAVEMVLNDDKDSDFKDIKRAFCAIRPPGHHAEYDRCMGFCIFNNIFIGAKYAQYVRGQLMDVFNSKIAIIDFDVHHGNGTQALAWNEQNILYVSVHQYDGEGMFYPGTGGVDECGAFDNVLNVPLKEGSNGEDVKNAFNEKIVPKMNAFGPDLIMVSAGFDGHKDDKLASLNLEESDYEWMTEQIVGMADEHCDGKIVSVLEGGYNLNALKGCVTAHVRALCG